jgi:hypothetical protein
MPTIISADANFADGNGNVTRAEQPPGDGGKLPV